MKQYTNLNELARGRHGITACITHQITSMGLVPDPEEQFEVSLGGDVFYVDTKEECREVSEREYDLASEYVNSVGERFLVLTFIHNNTGGSTYFIPSSLMGDKFIDDVIGRSLK